MDSFDSFFQCGQTFDSPNIRSTGQAGVGRTSKHEDVLNAALRSYDIAAISMPIAITAAVPATTIAIT